MGSPGLRQGSLEHSFWADEGLGVSTEAGLSLPVPTDSWAKCELSALWWAGLGASYLKVIVGISPLNNKNNKNQNSRNNVFGKNIKYLISIKYCLTVTISQMWTWRIPVGEINE